MNLYKKEIMKVFLKFVGRYCKEKPILIIKYDVEMVLHEKTEEEFIEWILKYSKENFSSEKHLELESKIKFIIGRNIKFEIPGTQQILDKIAIKKINVDLDVANERKILLKDIYDYCSLVEWKSKHINFLAQFLNVMDNKIIEWARFYAKENFGEEEYSKINQIIDRNRQLELLGMNVVLKNAINKTTDMLWENEYEKEIVLKYIYTYCEASLYELKKIENLADCLGVPESKIKQMAQQYAVEYLGYSIEEYIEHNHQCARKRLDKYQEKRGEINYKKIYASLLTANSLDEILLAIDIPTVPPHVLSSRVFDYVMVRHNGDKNILKQLREKIKIYADYVSMKKKEQKEIERNIENSEKRKRDLEKLPIIVALVTKFINDSDCSTIGEFCEQINMEKGEFEEYIMMLKEYDSEFYDIYIEKIANMNRKRYAIIVAQIKKIIKGLTDGIEENGVKRPFDIVDYYLITNFSFTKILELAKEVLSSADFIVIKKFISQNINNEKHDPSVITQIMNQRVFLSYQKDKKGNPIPGTEMLFSEEEKRMLIDYLSHNHIPINLKTYNIVYRRYRAGLLDLNKKNKKK